MSWYPIISCKHCSDHKKSCELSWKYCRSKLMSSSISWKHGHLRNFEVRWWLYARLPDSELPSIIIIMSPDRYEYQPILETLSSWLNYITFSPLSCKLKPQFSQNILKSKITVFIPLRMPGIQHSRCRTRCWLRWPLIQLLYERLLTKITLLTSQTTNQTNPNQSPPPYTHKHTQTKDFP